MAQTGLDLCLPTQAGAPFSLPALNAILGTYKFQALETFLFFEPLWSSFSGPQQHLDVMTL